VKMPPIFGKIETHLDHRSKVSESKVVGSSQQKDYDENREDDLTFSRILLPLNKVALSGQCPHSLHPAHP